LRLVVESPFDAFLESIGLRSQTGFELILVLRLAVILGDCLVSAGSAISHVAANYCFSYSRFTNHYLYRLYSSSATLTLPYLGVNGSTNAEIYTPQSQET
jgi:hypothetical protein